MSMILLKRYGILLLLALLTAPLVQAQTVTMTEVGTSVAGFDADLYVSNSNHNLGVNWIDIDNDGWVDLFVTNGKGSLPHLYQNDQDGTFTKVDNLLPTLLDVELAGSVFADYDNDGDQDIYIFATYESVNMGGETHPEGPANMLLKNKFVENGNQILPGQALFEDVAAAAGVDNLATPALGPDYPGYRSLTGGWLDYDRDGCVDLYVGTMVFAAGGQASNRNVLYNNNCDGTFTDATVAAGADVPLANYRPTLAFIAAHLDSDLYPDMYVVNVQLADPGHHDYVFKNNSGTFSEISGTLTGVGNDAGAGMGIDVADIDLDGDWEIYITDIDDPGNEPDPVSHGNTLYMGSGDGVWGENAAAAAGVLASKLAWGTNFFDVNQDGYEDLYVGDTNRHYLYTNDQDATFTDITVAAGMNTAIATIRGTATADYDHDGDLDLALVHKGGTLKLWRNDTVNSGNWFKLKLNAVTSNGSAIGTRVHLTAGGMNMMRQVKGGSSAHSQDDLVVHFGLGANATITQVQIFWPSGTVDVLNNVPANQLYQLMEGDTVLPVELAAFKAVTTGTDAVLAWSTASETNNAGFEVQHLMDGRFKALGFVPGAGTSVEGQSYQYRVPALTPGEHRFRLKQVDYDGAFAYSPEVAVTVEVPGAYHLTAVYPNPFNPQAQFTLTVPVAQQVRVGLYDLLGRQVRSVFAGSLPANQAEVIRMDGAGLSSGVYLLRIEGEQFSTVRRVTLLK